MTILRPYQSAAIHALRGKLREGKKRLVLIAPTGSGKTVCATHMIDAAVSRGKKVLFVAHRDLLIQQCSERLGDIDHGIIMASHPRRESTVQVASIQTMARRKEWPQADLIIIDEAHHATAKTYGRLFEHYSKSAFVGLTATPWRLDGKGLGDLFEDSVVASTPAQLIRSGDLAGYSGWIFRPPDLSGVKTTAGDYSGGQLASRVIPIMGNVVSQWLEKSSKLKTVCFAVNIEHANVLVARFRAAGVAAEVIHHEISDSDRRMCVDRVRDGRCRVICNVGILGEGVDIPDLECAILARPTKSLALYLQQVGRVMRPAPGKKRAVIHDHGGCMERHGLPDEDRDYSLTGGGSSETMDAVKRLVRGCPKCFALLPATQPWPCPECGHKPDLVASVEEGRAEALSIEDVGPSLAAQRREMEDYKRELVTTAISRGYKPGYVVAKFMERYPNAPKPWSAFRAVRARHSAANT